METKHTPGPWYAVDGNKHRDFNQIAIRASGLRRKTGGDVSVCHVERFNEANARLIAAAPELLQALKACWDLGIDEHLVPMVRAAIAKAEGK